jgi:hypothetical protein
MNFTRMLVPLARPRFQAQVHTPAPDLLSLQLFYDLPRAKQKPLEQFITRQPAIMRQYTYGLSQKDNVVIDFLPQFPIRESFNPVSEQLKTDVKPDLLMRISYNGMDPVQKDLFEFKYSLNLSENSPEEINQWLKNIANLFKNKERMRLMLNYGFEADRS